MTRVAHILAVALVALILGAGAAMANPPSAEKGWTSQAAERARDSWTSQVDRTRDFTDRSRDFAPSVDRPGQADRAGQIDRPGQLERPTLERGREPTATRRHRVVRMTRTAILHENHLAKHPRQRRFVRRQRVRDNTFNLLASLGREFRIERADVIARAKVQSKARQALLDRKIQKRIRAAGFEDGSISGAPLTRESYVRMGAVEQLFRKIDAMIMGGKLTHNDIRYENVRVTPDGTLVLVGWKQARAGGTVEADLAAQRRLRVKIERMLYH